jgi:hypothetical protein
MDFLYRWASAEQLGYVVRRASRTSGWARRFAALPVVCAPIAAHLPIPLCWIVAELGNDKDQGNEYENAQSDDDLHDLKAVDICPLGFFERDLNCLRFLKAPMGDDLLGSLKDLLLFGV